MKRASVTTKGRDKGGGSRTARVSPDRRMPEIHIHVKPDPETLRCLNVISQQQGLILEKLECIMTVMDDLKAAVARNTAVDESVITLLTGISQQLKDALATGNPAAIQEVITQLDANTQKMADAVTANTPTPTPTP